MPKNVSLAYRIITGILSLFFVIGSPPATAQRGTATRKPSASPVSQLFPQAPFLNAFKAVIFCDGPSGEPHPKTCNSVWRGNQWHFSDGGTFGKIVTPTGVEWSIECVHDSIEISDHCLFSTNKNFTVGFFGRHELITWGYDRFPGSEMVARLDSSTLIRTVSKDGWTFSQSEALLKRMSASALIRYRWAKWPEQDTYIDAQIDLRGFSDTVILMRAIAWNFGGYDHEGRDAVGE